MNANHPRDWDTGIKAMTLLAPVQYGQVISLSAPAKHGCQVLMVELLHRADARVVALGAQHRTRHSKDFELMFSDGLAPQHVRAQVVDAQLEQTALNSQIERACLDAQQWQRQSNKPVFCVFDVALLEACTDEVVSSLKSFEGITIILFEALLNGQQASPRWHQLADVVIRFSNALIQAGVYPALDPERCHGAPSQEDAVCTRVKQYWATSLPEDPRRQRLQMYLSQPFYTAEYFTGVPGEMVSRDQVFEDVQAILDGVVDDVPLEQLRFRGALSI